MSPSGSAVYWLFKANASDLPTLRRVDLVRLSLMSDQSFENGVKNALAAGLITYDKRRSKYGLSIIQPGTELKSQNT